MGRGIPFAQKVKGVLKMTTLRLWVKKVKKIIGVDSGKQSFRKL